MLRSNDWLPVITANSRQDVKPEMVPWQHLRKPYLLQSLGTEWRTRLRSSEEIQRKLDSGPQQVFYAKVRALPRSRSLRLGMACVNTTLGNPELSDPQNLLDIQWWPTVQDRESLFLEDHAGASNENKTMLIPGRISRPPLLPTRPITKIRSHNCRTPKTPILSPALS